MLREGLKKIIEFSIKDMTHPPRLIKKNNKKTCCFFGLFISFGPKNIFEHFSPASTTTATHWSHKLPSPPPPPTTDKGGGRLDSDGC